MRGRHSAHGVVESKVCARVFAALGDGSRLRLITLLGDAGPMSIARLTVGSRVTRQAISKHLNVLEQAGVVRSTRRGRERIWRLEQRCLREARRYLDQISVGWDRALGRLKQFVEK